MHSTRSYINYHITHLSCLDKRNFVYYSTLNWNNIPVVFRSLSMNTFMERCQNLLIV